MAFLERMIQRVYDGKWEAVLAQEKEWDALEAQVGGFPKKRRYRGYASPHGADFIVFEREWPSLAAYEATYTRLFAAPGYQELSQASDQLKAGVQVEMYGVLA